MNNDRRTKPIHYLEATVKKYPNKICIKEHDCELTYAQIHNNAKKLGYVLTKTIADIQKPILVFMDKGGQCLSTILAIQYSGNIYVPMDVKTPIDRLQAIIDTLGSDEIITDQKYYKTLNKIGYQGKVLMYEELIKHFSDNLGNVSAELFGNTNNSFKDANQDESKYNSQEALQDSIQNDHYDSVQAKIHDNTNNYLDKCLEEIDKAVVDTDIMYILFTSGSTGTPKGVAITYRSVVDYIEAFTAEVPISSDDIIGNQVPFYVDMSLKDIYMSIAVGATICVIPQKYFMTPKKVLQHLEDNNVTMLMWVPTAYSIIMQFDGLNKIRPASLKKFTFSGEGMPISVFQYWYDQYQDAEWIQLYGPTEITGACTYFRVERRYEDSEIIPIGVPFYNTGILLFDEEDNLIDKYQVGIPGEICVYGSCLAAGYYSNPQKTSEVFVQIPTIQSHEAKMYRTGDLGKWDEDGNLVFISRKDYQIKHGGRRIELGEIEAAVYSIEGIKTCCCVHDETKDQIVLFFVGDYDEKQIRELLRNKLPQYMVPGRYIKMDDLPRLSNGKLDRKGMKTIAVGENE